MRRFLPSRALAVVVAMLAMTMSTARVQAQDRVLGKQDILLYGFGLRVEPERQVVPKDIATIVSTFLQAPNTPPGDTPPFAPDAVVRATLRGPAVGNGLELTAKPNTPFNIPPLGVAGVHTLENIRLESGGEVLMRGVPESTTIEVIEKLLVTQVTARALTAQEIREKGIVFDKSNFQAYNFTAAFAIQDHPVVVNFPVVLPTLQGASDVSVSQVGLGGIRPPSLPELKTIIPDTLRLQTQIPNLKVVGFTLKVPPILGKDFYVPPIPGVVVIPGDIGFLNQFFSVMLMVGNVAPEGSNLTVDQLTGEILLPAGNDTVVGSSDDPLRMAQTAQGESPRIRFVVQPGPDGKVGTADDITTLGPGESGNAEYLVEGRREGTHIIEFNIAGTLHGLPVGPVAVTGRAAGSVLVRNPAFTLTFTHPDTVAAGEAYSLDVTVTNTSEAIANFVSVNLFSKNVSGATVVGDPSRQIESIPPGDSATVSFDMVSRVTGRVTAATLDADDNVAGRFSLKTAVGELGVPVSPDSLILPAPARSLPADLRNAALGLLGKAWAVATAPAAALPLDVSRFSKQIVYDRAIDVAEAGYRVSLHEPLTLSALQLEMDFIGSDFGRLAQKYPNADDLAFAERDFRGFDELRRRSVRGDTWAAAVGRVIAEELAGAGAAAFHRTFADAVSYRPPSVSVLVRAPAGPMPFTIRVVDAQGRRVGSTDEKGKVLKEIPFSDSISVLDATGLVTGQLVILAAPLTGEYHVQFDAVVGAPIDAPFDVSIVVPDATGVMRQVVYHATGGAVPASAFAPADPYRVLLDLPVAGAPSTGPLAVASDERIPPTVPRLLSAVQQANADIISCSVSLVTEDGLVDTFHVGYQAGRVIALLFSEEVTPESVQDRLAASDITRYLIDGNKVVGVALQPGGRIAFLALRDPIGPFVPRVITVDGVGGLRGGVMSSQSVAIESTVTDPGALVTGQVLNADGTPIPFANVRLLIDPCDPSRRGLVGVSSKTTDADGRFSWDFVVQGQVARIAAVDPATDDSRAVDFTSQRNGQRLNVNLVFLGRGTLKGRTLDEQGQPIPHANVRITSLTDQSQYGATSDDLGAFTIARIPVGNLFIEAVSVVADEDGHLLRNAKGTLAELIPVAGGTTVRDITLFDFITPPVDVKFGALAGHVLRGDGATPVNDVPVVAYYKTRSQANVTCPGDVGECAVGLARTDSTGAFLMDRLSAGEFKLVFFDQASFQQGEARVVVPENGTTNVNLLLSQGIGTVHGLVLDPAGQPVAGARVGGGLSLTTTDGTGQFTLIDVPVGRREIVAVSDALGTKGTAIVNLVQAGQTVEATVVLEPVAGVAGTVFQADGVTPVPFNAVYLFYEANGGIQVVGQTTTDATGRYAFSSLALRNDYRVSSFRPDFSDGNVKKIVLKFSNQVVRGDIVFRGGGGRITGRVLDSDGATPLKAAVSVSGEQLSVAGGMVGVGFSNVANFEVTETDFTTGQFAFSNIWVGPVTVTAIGQFSPDPIATEVTMPSPGATVNVELRLQATSRIEGTVFQPDGVTPVGPDVIVRYKSSEKKTVCASGSLVIIGSITIPPLSCADVPQGIQEEIVVTDANGRFLVPLVNAGQFTLTAEDVATGKTARVAGDVKPGQAGEFSMRLLGLGTLTINVRGSDSTTPIPGAAVEVRQIAFPKKTVLATADSAGTLQLDGGDAFSEGELVVMARDLRNGFEGRAAGKVIVDGEHVTINVFLFNQAGRVFGTVFKPDGLTPVPNADVVISNARGALAFGVTDGDGNYSQDTIPLGEFRVDVFEAATARLGFGLGRIDLDKQAVPVNVVELGRGLVTGTVLEVGTLAPVKNAEVILLQSSPGGRSLPSLQTTSGVDGTFSFPGATVGAFQVRASKTARLTGDPSGSATASATLGHDGERVDVPVLLTLNRPAYGRVEATVVNADGSPAPNVAVSLCASCSQYVGAITGPDGTVAFDHVVVGRFSVYAESQVNLSATSAHGELTFEGDLARVLLTLTGVSEVTGTVEFANGAPAANVEVTLSGSPSSGCQEASVRTCTVFANASGAFSFINVPARTFTVSARDPIGGLRGSVSGALTPGDHEVVRVVLEPTGRLSGRTVFLNGGPAAGVTVEAILPVDGPAPDEHFFEVTDQNGQFDYPALPIGTYAVSFEDPLGSGIARRTVVLTGDTDLGNIVLDDALPGVASVIPAAASVGVPRNTAVQIVFSEPVDAATVTQANISLVGPVSTVLGTLQLSAGDTTVTFTPLAPLVDQTLYSLTVQRIKDRIGK
ncbi:MAG: carboxypeptidase regulatory-like domain-containing protein, partial [Vicinamibacterales bacterium]